MLLPRRVGSVGLGVVPVFFSASYFLRAITRHVKASWFALFVAHSPEW